MKIIKLTVMLLFAIGLCGCREYGDKRMVKLVTVDREYVTLYYYDYSGDKPAYLTEQLSNDGVEKTLIQLLSQQNYDLKLCKYAVCDRETVQKDIQNLFWALINAKFSPDIEIIEGDTKDNAQKYIEIKEEYHPIYSYKIKDKSITGAVESADTGQKNIIVNSGFYKALDEKQSLVFDMLTSNTDKGVYTFEAGRKSLSAQLDNIAVFYSVDNNTLYINLFANLKGYKGMPANKESKKEFIKLAQRSITGDIKLLLEDKIIAENFNLLWYRNVEGFDNIKINTDIK